mmetsp:Transcript_9950/g.29496  ORF Transcript_9950/g.29496 Transcript_9950/m.29496 type:complete len:217 (+) Transcript_9950:944-1594(+)
MDLRLNDALLFWRGPRWGIPPGPSPYPNTLGSIDSSELRRDSPSGGAGWGPSPIPADPMVRFEGIDLDRPRRRALLPVLPMPPTTTEEEEESGASEEGGGRETAAHVPVENALPCPPGGTRPIPPPALPVDSTLSMLLPRPLLAAGLIPPSDPGGGDGTEEPPLIEGWSGGGPAAPRLIPELRLVSVDLRLSSLLLSSSSTLLLFRWGAVVESPPP